MYFWRPKDLIILIMDLDLQKPGPNQEMNLPDDSFIQTLGWKVKDEAITYDFFVLHVDDELNWPAKISQ